MAGRLPRARNNAAYVLAGALIGALASFGGSYLAYEQQASLDALTTKRAAYAAYVAEVEQYHRGLIRLKDAAEDNDEARYVVERAALTDASGEMYTAAALAWLVADEDISALLDRTTATLFDFTPDDQSPTSTEYDALLALLNRLITASNAAAKEFLAAAREDLADE